MKNAYTLVVSMAAVLLLSISSIAEAQPGPGSGMGPGSGYGMGPGGGGGGGMGQGNGRGRGFAFNTANTRGWALMTPEEQTAHRNKMFSAKSYDECKSIQETQHKAMMERAKEQGKTLPSPRQNGCDRMKARGYFN